jgi:GAF domain-containing protein
MDDPEKILDLLLAAAALKPAADRPAEVIQGLVIALSKAFDLRTDEVAILVFSQDRELLKFVYPPELAEKGGSAFPVSVPSLAGRVATTGDSLLYNDMREVPRLAFYERVRIHGAEPMEIQKLLAVAVKGGDGQPRAVIEVSRRARNLAEAGPDFHPEDLRLLERLAAAASGAMAQAFGQ